MNAPDKHTLLMNHLMELEEASVLSLVQERLADGDNPLEIIEDAQEGLRRVGERYQQRQYYISGLMLAGEIFREIMELVQPRLVQGLSRNASGHILLGTVQGDIHDIGKNIFATLLRCHGFTVTDLGVDVSPAQFLHAASRVYPDLIALSGLLTLSFDSMKATVQTLRQADDPRLRCTPFIIGGGIVNAEVCGLVGANYWATDAMVGIDLCKQMIAPST